MVGEGEGGTRRVYTLHVPRALVAGFRASGALDVGMVPQTLNSDTQAVLGLCPGI